MIGPGPGGIRASDFFELYMCVYKHAACALSSVYTQCHDMVANCGYHVTIRSTKVVARSLCIYAY
jgi:hypothetical protein